MSKERTIRVVFPSYLGDESRMMTIQELETGYKDYLIIDPDRNQIDLESLANLDDIQEVVVIPPIAGG